VTDALVWPILAPLAGATVGLLGGRRAAVAIGLTTAGATLAAAAAAGFAVWQHGGLRHSIGGWGAPLGIDLVADGLSVTMLLMAGAVGAGISLYAAGYFTGAAHAQTVRAFWPLWLFLWASLNAVFLSGDVFNLYVALELLTLSSVGLVVLAPGRQALTAATRYLLAAFLASMAYLLGVALLYGGFGALDIETLGQRVVPGWTASGALALITAALLLKTALFPLHFWLPRAHASAVTPASAILSALVVKASFYITVRLWNSLFPEIAGAGAAQLVGALGAAAILWGSIQASRQGQLKLLVGYSTVSQIGYLFLLFPLTFPVAETGAWREAAAAGGVIQAVTHAFAKAAMFLAAGLMIHPSRAGLVAGVAGAAARAPVAVFAFGLAGLSVIGLPPSGGFVGKWLLLGASIAAGQWWWAVVILAGGLVSAGYVFLVLGYALTPAPAGESGPPAVLRVRWLEYVCLWLATLGFALGLRATEAIQLIGGGNG
jgi:multicomponent Na+:H+ antiporter subunit D